jgi:hypothetical protein
MCTPSEQISKLSTWCDTNGIKIDARLEIRHTEHSGVSVFAARDVQINVSETGQSNAGNMPTRSETGAIQLYRYQRPPFFPSSPVRCPT